MIRSAARSSLLSGVAAILVVAILVAACSGSDGPAAQTLDVPETVAIGVLPDPLSDSPTLPPPPPPPTTGDAPATTDTGAQRPIAGQLGTAVRGDRILFVGDAALASVRPPEDQQLCDALSLFGWQASLEAVSGSDNLGFVSEVLDLRLRPADDLDWDAIALFIGNELPVDALGVTELTEVLEATITRVAPRPVVIYTLTESEPGRSRFNDVIRQRAAAHPNVLIIDWAELGGVAADVVGDDGVSLSSDGRKRLPLYTADALGKAPADPDGECLPPEFEQDQGG